VKKRPGKLVDDPAHVYVAPLPIAQALKSRVACNTGSSRLYCMNTVALPLPLAKLPPSVRLMS